MYLSGPIFIMEKTKEEIIYDDYNFICEQLYRILVEGKEMIITYKEMFSFLEQLSLSLKRRAELSKIQITVNENTMLSTNQTVGELYRDLSKQALFEKLVKLDRIENLKRVKNKNRRARNLKNDEESYSK